MFDAWVFDNTTQTLNVRFKSDSSVRSSGFLARFCFVPECEAPRLRLIIKTIERIGGRTLMEEALARCQMP